MTKQKEEKQDDSLADFEPLDLDVDDQFWENYQREQHSDQVRQARKLAQQTQRTVKQPKAADQEDDRTDELDAFNALHQPTAHARSQNRTTHEESQTRQPEHSSERKGPQKKQTQHLGKDHKERVGKTQNLDFEPLSQDNHIRVMHYFIYGVFYIFHFMISFKINFFIFPTIFILGGFIGLKKSLN